MEVKGRNVLNIPEFSLEREPKMKRQRTSMDSHTLLCLARGSTASKLKRDVVTEL